VCLIICLPFTHSPVSETSPYRVKTFTIKWSLKANLVGRIRILFILTFANFRVLCILAISVDSRVRLNRLDWDICNRSQAEPPNQDILWSDIPIGVLHLERDICKPVFHSSLHVQGYRHCPGLSCDIRHMPNKEVTTHGSLHLVTMHHLKIQWCKKLHVRPKNNISD
jgi:hypothetical protein